MRGDIHILSKKEIEDKLKDFPGWEFQNDKIKKFLCFTTH